MFPHPMSRSEFRSDDSHPDLTRVLEEHLLAGLQPDLALDLVLNELVVRATAATRASAAALALTRGDEMVCRAATGHLAPDLGVPLNTHDGLSGACLQTRQPQLSVDTEFDPRVDPTISHLGIRSILIVPVFDTDNNSEFTGILEVFSTSPAAFSHFDQKLLEGFAEECSRAPPAPVRPPRRRPAPVHRSQPSARSPPSLRSLDPRPRSSSHSRHHRRQLHHRLPHRLDPPHRIPYPHLSACPRQFHTGSANKIRPEKTRDEKSDRNAGKIRHHASRRSPCRRRTGCLRKRQSHLP